jgi:DNA-binding NarL/FixJ family response regulator
MPWRWQPNSLPDLVLMDLSMPGGISGIEATARILAARPRALVVVLSSSSPGPGLARALEAGARATVRKTAPPPKLVRTLRQILAGDEIPTMSYLAHDILVAGDLPESDLPESPPTERELDVLSCVCQGMGPAQIATELFLSPATVRTHIGRLHRKLHAGTAAQLIVRALQFKYFTPA